jgi:hypothetical protein
MHACHLILCIGLCKDFQRLQISLEAFKSTFVSNPENLTKVTQDAIHSAITAAVLKTEDVNLIRDQMYDLCHTTFDVPADLTDWAKEQVEEECKRMTKKSEDPKPTSAPAPCETPLFNKDTLYHASLCCQAVGNKKVQYKKFLNEQGHTLKEVSMSSEDQNNVLIAKQGNTVYFAFESEPSLSKWRKYESFSKGEYYTDNYRLHYHQGLGSLLGPKANLEP